MMKNKKLRSVVMKQIRSISDDLSEYGVSTLNVGEIRMVKCPNFEYVTKSAPSIFLTPNKEWDEYLTELPIVHDDDNLKLKFRNTPKSYESDDITKKFQFVKLIGGVTHPAGIIANVYFIPKDKTVEDIVATRSEYDDYDSMIYRVCTFSGPLKIGDEGGEEVVNDITTTINNPNPSEFPSNLSEYLQHNVKNNGYGKDGNKKLYIILQFQYRDDVFAFYVD
jgi:hypothetical protein